MMTEHLYCRGLRLSFGGVVALSSVDLSFAPGKVTAVMGPNGAGKTTLLNCISGTNSQYKGEVALGEISLDQLPPRARAAKGLVRTFQITRVFDSMTVEENIFFAASVIDLDLEQDRCHEILDLLQIARMASRNASELSGGQRRLLEIGMCIAQEPAFLLMDEPFAGLNPMVVRTVCDVIRQLAGKGTGVAIVSHEIPLMRQHADTMIVMAQGAVLIEGAPAEVVKDPRVVEVYLGGKNAVD